MHRTGIAAAFFGRDLTQIPRDHPQVPGTLIGRRLLVGCRHVGHLLLATAERTVHHEAKRSRTRVSERARHYFFAGEVIGFMVADTKQVLEANDTCLHLLGYTREDLLADRLRWSVLVAPEHLPAVERSIHQALSRGFSAPAECVCRRQDGGAVPIVLGLALLQRDPVHCVGFVFDLTERTKVEREREEARINELARHEITLCKDQFLDALSHELRTPLTCLQGYMQLLAQRFSGWEPQESSTTNLAENLALARTAVAYSARSVGRITQLVDDLLDEARIHEGCLDYHFQRCELSTIVGWAVEEQRVLAANRIIRLELPAAQATPVLADAPRIGQVAMNFLSNALKYSRECRPVTVRLEVEGGSVRVSVRDEGVGIPLTDQARIWERFHTAAGVSVQSGSGVSLGLGLHISRTFIERHHGQVGVISEPGQGATFWFALPLAEPGA